MLVIPATARARARADIHAANGPKAELRMQRVNPFDLALPLIFFAAASLRLSARVQRAGYFSLLAQREVTKRNAPRMPRSRDEAARVREVRPGFVERTSLYVQARALPRYAGEAKAFAVGFRSCLSLLIFLPLHRTEHRRRQRGKGAHVRAQGCASSRRPADAEKRRAPRAHSARGAVSGRVSLGDFSLHEQREVTRSPQASGSSCSSVEKHQS
ncbi:hypothetical protein, partial [Rudaea sp.]|uniref:hypothetical protein n=1 Tax=Rudaea sp. TaxID=2136325 RepID=UPI0032201C2E